MREHRWSTDGGWSVDVREPGDGQIYVVDGEEGSETAQRPIVGRLIRRFGLEILRLAEQSRATTFALQEDVAALCRAAGIGDHARPISPHEVVQRELIPAVERLAKRVRELEASGRVAWEASVNERDARIRDLVTILDVRDARIAALEKENARLRAWLQAIDGGDNPIQDEARLRQMAYEAITLGRPAP